MICSIHHICVIHRIQYICVLEFVTYMYYMQWMVLRIHFLYIYAWKEIMEIENNYYILKFLKSYGQSHITVICYTRHESVCLFNSDLRKWKLRKYFAAGTKHFQNISVHLITTYFTGDLYIGQGKEIVYLQRMFGLWTW